MFESQQLNDREDDDQPVYSEAIALENLSSRSDLSDQYYAAWWLGRMRSRHPQTIPALLHKLTILNRKDLSVEERGIALNAIRALGKLDAVDAIEPLIQLLRRSDIQIQVESAISLGTLHACKAIPDLVSILQSIQTNHLNDDQVNKLQITVIKTIGAIGTSHPSVLEIIQGLAEHPIPLLRSASCSTLVRLTNDPCWIKSICLLLNHSEPLVRRGALLDLGASGHPDALEAIQAAGVESSLKLIALRMLAEQTPNETIFDAMDGLL